MKAWQKVAIGAVVIGAFTIPVFRSGGRTGLTFFQWVKEHSIWGSPIQFVPEEDYRRELEGVKITREVISHSQQSDICQVMAFHQINEESATKLANQGK